MNDENVTERLLRLAGTRLDVEPERTSRVRQAVLDEWQAVTARRAARRRALVGVSLAALAATAVIAVLVMRSPGGVRVPDVVATVEEPRETARPVTAGERIAADEERGLALRLTRGESLRLAGGTSVRLLTGALVELERGAVYVDSGRDGASQVEIRTPFGAIRDVGTQFEVRLMNGLLRIRVRTGLVELQRGDDVLAARPGTELTVDRTGVTSRVVAPYGGDWAWAAALAPGFAIDGRSLAAFLEHVCREHGWTLVYGDGELGREASGIVLRGSVEGLSPEDAVAVTLATSGLTHRLTDGRLEVSRRRMP